MIDRVVVDTNVLVSALWTPGTYPFKVVEAILNKQCMPCFDSQMLREYRVVLSRPKFKFTPALIDDLLSHMERFGLSVVIRKPSTIPMPDESDRVFYDVAKACDAFLITGNKKHYPDEPHIVTPRAFFELLSLPRDE